ncbi:fibronectin type III domain-containing protein, partial [Patescibacteria group bacterium]
MFSFYKKLYFSVGIAIFCILISANFAFASSNFVVEVWDDGSSQFVLLNSNPLFNESNFLAGEAVSRRVRVSNNSDSSEEIATEAINFQGFPNPANVPSDDLARVLDIVISAHGGQDIYGGSTGNKKLFDFFNDGETYLSDVSANGVAEYDFEIIFPSAVENEWQSKTTSFDILVGFKGTEGGGGTSGGGGGIILPRGLTIFSEASIDVGTSTATIIWTTNYFSTSQVIYDTVDGNFSLSAGAPEFGYAYYKEGDDSGDEKVTAHSVTITGLTSGIDYYYRTVSYASPATISGIHSFTTLENDEVIDDGTGDDIGGSVQGSVIGYPIEEDFESEEFVIDEETKLNQETEIKKILAQFVSGDSGNSEVLGVEVEDLEEMDIEDIDEEALIDFFKKEDG